MERKLLIFIFALLLNSEAVGQADDLVADIRNASGPDKKISVATPLATLCNLSYKSEIATTDVPEGFRVSNKCVPKVFESGFNAVVFERSKKDKFIEVFVAFSGTDLHRIKSLLTAKK